MKFPVLIIWLLSTFYCGAQDFNRELVRSMLQASEKPFPEFVDTTIKVTVPYLPLPAAARHDQPLVEVSNLLWKRLRALDLDVNLSDKKDKIHMLHAMLVLREWLLTHDDYTSLLFAAYIDKNVSFAVIAALCDKVFTAEEAMPLLGGVTKSISKESILAFANRSGFDAAKQAATVRNVKRGEVKRDKVDLVNLHDIAEILSKELDELLDTRIEKLIEKERPASLILYSWHVLHVHYLASNLVEYAAKGGDLSLRREKLAEEFAKVLRGVVGQTVPATGVKIEAEMFSALTEDVREWKAEVKSRSDGGGERKGGSVERWSGGR